MTRTEKVEKIIVDNYMFMIPFIGFFVLLRISPMMYDGWAGSDYYNNQGGLVKWIAYVLGPFYLQINGRVASDFVSGILESFPSEIMLDSINTFVMTMICWALCKIFRINETKKKLLVAILYFSLIQFMPISMRTYVIQIANAAYVPPIFFCLLFFLICRKYMEQPEKAQRWMLWGMCVLAFCNCTWMEHTAVGFGITLGVSLLYLTYRDRKIYWYLWIATVVALLSGLLMMLAPSLRMNRTILVGNTGFATMFFNNIKYLYLYLLHDNMFITIVFFVLLSFLMAQRGWKKSIFYKVLCVVDALMAVLFVVIWLNEYIISNQIVEEYANMLYYGIVNNRSNSILTLICVMALVVSGLMLCKCRKPLMLLGTVAVFFSCACYCFAKYIIKSCLHRFHCAVMHMCWFAV